MPADLIGGVWATSAVVVLLIASVAALVLRSIHTGSRMAVAENAMDEVSQLVNRTPFVGIAKALAISLDHARHITDRVAKPMWAFAIVGAAVIILSVSIPLSTPAAVNQVTTADPSVRAAPLAGLAALCALIGALAPLGVSVLYRTFTPVVGLDVALRIAGANHNLRSGFWNGTMALATSNVLLAVASCAFYTATSLLVCCIAKFGLHSTSLGVVGGHAALACSAAAGAHAATLVMAAMGTSFAEGMAIALYKVEAESQHRVDGTLRIAANTLQSAAGVPAALCGMILDLHVLVLFSGIAASPWFVPVFVSCAIVGTAILLPLLPASDGRTLTRKARLAVVLATFINVGLGILVIKTSGSLVEVPMGRLAGSLSIGGLIAALIVLNTEVLTNIFAQVAGEHCDISPTAGANSITAFSKIFSFVAITIVAGTGYALSYAWGRPALTLFYCGLSIPLLPLCVVFANARCASSCALCFSKTSSMTADIQEVLEGLLHRCELFEGFSYMHLAIAAPVVLLGLFNPKAAYAASTWNPPLLMLSGAAFLLLTDGLARFYLSRTTWRLYHPVAAIVSTGDSRRASSIQSHNHGGGGGSGDSGDRHHSDNPFRGDALIGAMAVVHVAAMVGFTLLSFYLMGDGCAFAIQAGCLVIAAQSTSHSAQGALGAAVKNFVVLGGLTSGSRYASQHGAAVHTAASSTPLAAVTNVLSLSAWRVTTVLLVVAALSMPSLLG